MWRLIEFSNFYKNLFTASMTHNEEEVLKYIRVISDEDNQILMLPEDEEEIKRELFQINWCKQSS